MASQVATLDQLSGGRGLRDRARRMDEGIDLIRMLWAGGRSYHGTEQGLPGSFDLIADGETPADDPQAAAAAAAH